MNLTNICIFLITVVIPAVHLRIIEGPQNSLKKHRERAELKCKTYNGNCAGIDWKKQEGNASPKPVFQDGTGMLNPDQFPQERYNVDVSRGGNCTLKITNLKLNDSGKFICIETANGGQDTKSAVLVVIIVKTACETNATNVARGNKFIMQCVVSIPGKATEPSNVTLSWFDQNDTRLTTVFNNEQRISDLTSSYTAIAEGQTVPKYNCSASFPPEEQPNYDNTTANLDICETREIPVSYPVTRIYLSPEPKNNKVFPGDVIKCIADGFPTPDYEWRNQRTGKFWKTDTLNVTADVAAEENYTCTASNTVKGQTYRQQRGVTAAADANILHGPYLVLVVVIAIIATLLP